MQSDHQYLFQLVCGRNFLKNKKPAIMLIGEILWMGEIKNIIVLNIKDGSDISFCRHRM